MLEPIKTKEQYNIALARVYQLMQENINPGSAKSNEPEVLSVLVKQFETEHYTIPAPNPIVAAKFRIIK
jgi:HTH-type transcriptional regulator/antitoxin HigA